MSSIRHIESSSTLSATASNISNPARSSSEHRPQYAKQIHHRHTHPEPSTSNTDHTTKHTPSRTPSSASLSSSSTLYSHDPNPTSQDPGTTKPDPAPSNTKKLSPRKHSNKAENKTKSKPSRNCLGELDWTYSGLYVSGSTYGRKTIGTGTGAPGSGGCVVM